MKYYMLRKNGETIYHGTEWDQVVKFVPTVGNFKETGNVYDLSHISFSGDKIVFSYHSDVRDFYSNIKSKGNKEAEAVTVPIVGLESLLRTIKSCQVL
ncbi:hypothetical protein HYX19_02245 [Candidatus Woesearchaeota archaeon]|nr:hypothetical protein [Candidatus Woesearchaeota archaeon]